MSRIYGSVSSCLHKNSVEDTDNADGTAGLEEVSEPGDLKENDAPELKSDKKTDEMIEPQKPASLMWRLSSGLYNTTTGAITGAVGLGVGGAKWVAHKGYDAGSVVVTTTKNVAAKVPVPTSITRIKRKTKNE